MGQATDDSKLSEIEASYRQALEEKDRLINLTKVENKRLSA
jgi:hypothetical protein